jgi:UDP-N-acetylmuramate--alanine ligase
VCCADNANVRSIFPKLAPRVITYGLAASADYRGKGLKFDAGKSTFVVYRNGGELGQVTTALSGMHNVRNALAAIAVCCELGVDFSTISANIGLFCGVKRRFETKGIARGVTVIDDYAHHPDEIEATADAARRAGHTRIVAVFQPHLYSRTQHFADRFARSLMQFDCAVVTEIYRSREKEIPGVSAVSIVTRMKDLGHRKAFFVPDKKSVVEALLNRVGTGDTVIVMGAGDIWKIIDPLLEALRNG